MSFYDKKTEQIYYSPTGRYACRLGAHEYDSSNHEVVITDFESGRAHSVELLSNYFSKIRHIYWIDDAHLAVIYKQTFLPVNIMIGGIGPVELHIPHNRECRMLFKIELTGKKKMEPITRKEMKAYLNMAERSKIEPVTSDQFLTVDGKDYVVMYYEALPSNISKPWADIPEDDNPLLNQNKLIEFGHKKDFEKFEKELTEQRYHKVTEEVYTQFSKIWFRFIPKNFEDEDNLPDVQLDIREVLKAVKFDELAYVTFHDGGHGGLVGSRAHFSLDHSYYLMYHGLRTVQFDFQAYFNQVRQSGVKPELSTFCKAITIPISPKDDERSFIGINNGFACFVQKKKCPSLTVNGFLGETYNKAMDFSRKISMKYVWGPMIRCKRHLNIFDDAFINIVDIRNNKFIGTYKVESNSFALQQTRTKVTVHPSGQLLSTPKFGCFTDFKQEKKTRRNTWFKLLELAPVKTEECSLTILRQSLVDEESVVPKFVRNKKKNLGMKLRCN